MRSTRWSTPGARWSWPPTALRAISNRSTSACARGSPAASASRWRARRAVADQDPGGAHRRRARGRTRTSRSRRRCSPLSRARSSRTGAISKARSTGCIAHCTLDRPPLTVEAAEAAIRDLIRAREPKRVKIEDIQKLVASHYSVTRADILSSRRTAVVVKPRQVAMYPRQDAHAALAAGNRPPLRRTRSHDRAARGAQDRGRCCRRPPCATSSSC